MYRLLYLLFFCIVAIPLRAWRAWPLPMDSVDNCRDTLSYFGEFAGVASSGRFAPFWLSANTDGVVSVAPYGAYLRVGMDKEALRSARWWDYSYGVDCRLQITDNRLQITGDRAQGVGYGLQVVKLYGQARLWCFDVTMGVKPFDVGNQDYELSSGGFLLKKPEMLQVMLCI